MKPSDRRPTVFTWLIRSAQKKNLVPRMSTTERQALEAGTVWMDGEIFSGKPRWERLLALGWPRLTERERAFLDGPVEEVCGMVDDWRLTRERRLPEEVWAYLRRERFFGLAIPEAWGGHGFSALALSTIFGKLASRSMPLSAVVLIPNSVGPAELLLEYGTEEQKQHFLPRLARGEEIPCFALTEPGAGSDAAALASEGVVFRGDGGEPRLRLTWEKRYITLAPVATLLGLAFRLRDPENLLGRGPEPGITVALVDTTLPGVEIGRRHDPMGVPFPNGPVTGRGVVLPVDRILGGPDHAGLGWKMLMEALSAGRSLSLPAQSVGGAKAVARRTGAYAAVRRQFGLPIGRFEGIEEPLARLGGLLYLMEAARGVTCGAVDAGHRPAVLSGVVKVHQTELARSLVTDAMDVFAGAAIFRGPRNPLGNAWLSAPIGITVEGANILTRSLIIFGQGVIRCHPWAGAVLGALRDGDPVALRRALAGHLRSFVGNGVRAAVLGLTRGRLARSPVGGPMAPYFRKLAWASARFALLTDLALVSLGADLKRKEKLSGRFADALSWIYLGMCTVARFEGEGRREEDLPLARWAVETALARVQEAFEGIHRNFEGPLGWWMRTGGLWLRRLAPLGAPPSDRLGAQVARVLLLPGAHRDRLTEGIYLSRDPQEVGGRLERALELTAQSAEAEAAVARAVKAGTLPRGTAEERAGEALAAGVIPPEQADLLRRAAQARREAIQVDVFSLEEYLGLGGAAAEQTITAPEEAPVAGG
jgi:acyl-CoA dehydrogenase